MIDRCNAYLVGKGKTIYASCYIVNFQNDQAYDANLIIDIQEKFYDYLKGRVRAPTAAIVPFRSALFFRPIQIPILFQLPAESTHHGKLGLLVRVCSHTDIRRAAPVALRLRATGLDSSGDIQISADDE